MTTDEETINKIKHSLTVLLNTLENDSEHLSKDNIIIILKEIISF